MKLSFGLNEYIISASILLILTIILNSMPIFQLILGLLLLFILAITYGNIIVPNTHIIYKILVGVISIFSLVIIIGSLFVYFLAITKLSLAALWFLIFLLPLIFYRKKTAIFNFNLQLLSLREIYRRQTKFHLLSCLLTFAFVILVAILVYFFVNASTADAIFSPWLLLSKAWIFVYIGLALIMLFKIIKSKNDSWLLILSLFFFISLSLGAFLYKLGYGFDFHIHKATTEYIWQYGSISPKPLYYIGYYSLILNLKWLLGLSLSFLNTWLVPILFSFLVPGFIYFSFSNSFDFKKVIIRFLPLVWFALPYSLYTFTTPQSLANTFFVLLVFAVIPFIFKKEFSILFLWLIAIATAFIHPIAGVPAILLVLFINLREWRTSNYIVHKQRKFLFILISILGGFALPILFFLNSLINGNSISWKLPSFSFSLPNYHQYLSIFDFVYNLLWLLPIIIIILLVISIKYIISMKRVRQFSDYFILMIILFVNFIWLKYFISFDFLLDNERLNYSNRILNLLFIACLPIICIALSLLINKIAKHNKIVILGTMVIFISFISVSFYLSYPRRDQYFFNKSINTTITDFQVVEYIDNASENNIILSNQAVSAAAINKFGFKTYHNNVFYYPLPTSGPLYQLFLDAAYQRKDANSLLADVCKLACPENMYLVINSYWHNAPNLINSYKKTAHSWQQFSDNTTFVFHYNLPNKVSQ
jgi:hypothetical protein